MPVLWEIDPTSEDATNVPLPLVDSPFSLLEMDLTPPDVEATFAASADTEGDPYVGSRHRNRVISLTLLGRFATDALLQTAIYEVQQKLDKLRREGGTLKLTTQAGSELVGDVLYARFKPEFTVELYGINQAMKFVLEFDCKPYFRGAPVQLTDHAETTLPCVIGTDTGIVGDVRAGGTGTKLVIDEDQGADQFWLMWGIRSRYYDSATSAALFYEAEGRTAQGGSATAAGPTGASGGGSNVMRNTALATSYQSVLSTQATGGGAHLSHVGDYKIWARIQVPTTNTGDVTVALEWAEGDFRRGTRNAEYAIDQSRKGSWVLADLGQVHLTKVTQGTQRWEGRVLAKSTIAGDDIDVDCLFIAPTTEGYGEVSALAQLSAPSSFSARDEFDQSAAALTGKTLPVGGTWTGAGDTDDFAVETTGKTAQRTSTSDTIGAGPFLLGGGSIVAPAAGRFATASTPTLTATLVQVSAKASAMVGQGAQSGVLARYTDVNNYCLAVIDFISGFPLSRAWVCNVVAGTASLLGVVGNLQLTTNTFYELQLMVDAAGRFWFWVAGQPVIVGQSSVLATGGTLASGKPGFYDINMGASACTRNYDDFAAWAPPADAAVFASQSLEVRADQVIREDSGGTIWTPPSQYEGDYFKPPPAGQEARTLQLFVKASRNHPSLGPDSAIDDTSARLTYTPRYLVLPA